MMPDTDTDDDAVRAFFVSDALPRKRRRRDKSAEKEDFLDAVPKEEERTRTVLAQPLWARTADCTVLQIQQKLAGYVRQDERKGRAEPEPPLTVAATLALLEAAAFRCTYCTREMPRVWSAPRDPAQWTLDRVDNARPHQIDNVVPSCMECNLRRRARSHWAFRRGAALAAATVEKTTVVVGALRNDDDGSDHEWVVTRNNGSSD